nr:LysR family transcriptional regulator [Aquamicrobium sp. LC103]
MRYFAKTVEFGNITKAAETLLVAQPALGLQIRQLEEELGVPLLIRHSRGVSPTEAGQRLYVRALEILELVERTRSEVALSGRGERETIVLGLTNGTTALIGTQLIRDADAALPNIQLSLVEEMSSVLVDALDRGEVDIALAYDAPEKPGLLRIPLIEEEVVFVHAATDKDDPRPIAFSSVLAMPLVLPNERDVIRVRLQALANQLALPLRIGYEVSSIGMLKRLVADGASASVMPYASVLDYVEAGRLSCRRIVDPTPKRTLYLVRSTRRGRFVQEDEFVDFLQSGVHRFIRILGDLAVTLPVMDTPFSKVMARLTSDSDT